MGELRARTLAAVCMVQAFFPEEPPAEGVGTFRGRQGVAAAGDARVAGFPAASRWL